MFILKSKEKRMRRRTFIMAGKHISIPALLKIGAGALDNLGIYLKELQLQKVVVLFGNGLVEMFGSTVMEAFANRILSKP